MPTRLTDQTGKYRKKYRKGINMLDLFDLSEAVIDTRMALHFAISPRAVAKNRKCFVIGHPRNGTTSLHHLFLSSGCRSIHTSADWRTDQADCFSDKGQNRPFKSYDRYYENAQFILNCRPVGQYLRSLEHVFQRDFSPHTFKREILRRSAHFDRVLAHFKTAKNLIVVNIEKPGAMQFVADQLALTPSTEATKAMHNPSKRTPSENNLKSISEALKSLGVSAHAPLLSQTLSAHESFKTLQEMTAQGRAHL